MTYIFDSNVLIDIFRLISQTGFPTFWQLFDDATTNGLIVSVREVYNEVVGRGDRLSEWCKNNKGLFTKPSRDELLAVQDIFSIPHFQGLLRKQTQLQGRPFADPFLIAKGRVYNSCVITLEASRASGAANIPAVCKHFGVNCGDLEHFMSANGWVI